MRQFLPPRYSTGISNRTSSRPSHIQYIQSIRIFQSICMRGYFCPLSISSNKVVPTLSTSEIEGVLLPPQYISNNEVDPTLTVLRNRGQLDRVPHVPVRSIYRLPGVLTFQHTLSSERGPQPQCFVVLVGTPTPHFLPFFLPRRVSGKGSEYKQVNFLHNDQPRPVVPLQ